MHRIASKHVLDGQGTEKYLKTKACCPIHKRRLILNTITKATFCPINECDELRLKGRRVVSG